MIYIFILLTTFVYYSGAVNKRASFSAFFIASLPIVFLLTIVPGFQYSVGNDYFNYLGMVDDIDSVTSRYSSEFIFYNLALVVNMSSLDSQYIFVFVAAINATLFFFATYKFQNMSNANGIFFLFLLITTSTIFHAQMNLLRQSVAMISLLVASLFFVEKKIRYGILWWGVAVGFHKSAIPMLAVLFLIFMKPRLKSNILIFFASFFLYLYILPPFLEMITSVFFPAYLFYFNGSQDTGSIINVLTKLYYVPAFLVSMIISFRKDDFLSLSMQRYNTILSAFILSPLLMLSNDIFGRFSLYFSPFLIFPLSYLMLNSEVRFRIVFLIYCFFPYVLKVLVFPSGEYTYTSIFN